MIRRSVLELAGGFDVTLSAAEDWDMWLRLAALCDIDNVPDVLVSIDRHRTGVFRNVRRMEENQWAVYRKAVNTWPEQLSRTDRRRMRALIFADAAGECVLAGQLTDGLAYYLRSLQQWPYSRPRVRAAAVLCARTLFGK
jgi:hypothetical protein